MFPVCDLVEERRQIVDEKTRQSNRLTAELKLYFPQIPHWFDDVTTPLVGALLERCRLIVAFGTRRDRYQSAYEIQCYSGIAPVKEASGKTEWVHFRFVCPKFLRQTFHEFASHSIGQSEWAKAYYDHLRKDEKKSHHAAVRALGYKWIRIIFRCWKDGKPYDEQVYLNSLRRRAALLGAAVGAATGARWKTVAGFQKLSENNA